MEKCRYCGIEIYFDRNIKSESGKPIPIEVRTDKKHDCISKPTHPAHKQYFGAERSQDTFMEDMIHVAQVVFSDIDSYNRTDTDKEYFKEIKPLMASFLTAKGFPSVALTKMLDGKSLDSSDRTDLRDFVIARGGFQALSIFFGSTGLLTAVVEVARRYYPKTYEITEKYFDLQSVSYASSICSTLILLYPHESFGRYPKNIMGTTTEEIYSQKTAKISQYIDDCKTAYEHIITLM